MRMIHIRNLPTLKTGLPSYKVDTENKVKVDSVDGQPHYDWDSYFKTGAGQGLTLQKVNHNFYFWKDHLGALTAFKPEIAEQLSEQAKQYTDNYSSTNKDYKNMKDVFDKLSAKNGFLTNYNENIKNIKNLQNKEVVAVSPTQNSRKQTIKPYKNNPTIKNEKEIFLDIVGKLRGKIEPPLAFNNDQKNERFNESSLITPDNFEKVMIEIENRLKLFSLQNPKFDIDEVKKEKDKLKCQWLAVVANQYPNDWTYIKNVFNSLNQPDINQVINSVEQSFPTLVHLAPSSDDTVKNLGTGSTSPITSTTSTQKITKNRINTVGDGNCLIYSMFGNKVLAKEGSTSQLYMGNIQLVRRQLANSLRIQFIDNNTERITLQDFGGPPTNTSIEEMATAIEQENYHLGLKEAHLLAKLYEKNLVVYRPTGNKRKLERKLERIELNNGINNDPPIQLYFNGVNHWERVVFDKSVDINVHSGHDHQKKNDYNNLEFKQWLSNQHNAVWEDEWENIPENEKYNDTPSRNEIYTLFLKSKQPVNISDKFLPLKNKLSIESISQKDDHSANIKLENGETINIDMENQLYSDQVDKAIVSLLSQTDRKDIAVLGMLKISTDYGKNAIDIYISEFNELLDLSAKKDEIENESKQLSDKLNHQEVNSQEITRQKAELENRLWKEFIEKIESDQDVWKFKLKRQLDKNSSSFVKICTARYAQLSKKIPFAENTNQFNIHNNELVNLTKNIYVFDLHSGQGGGHYQLGILDLKNKKLTVINSMNSDKEYHAEVNQAVKTQLLPAILDKLNRGINENQITVEHLDGRKQFLNNGCSSGVLANFLEWMNNPNHIATTKLSYEEEAIARYIIQSQE